MEGIKEAVSDETLVSIKVSLTEHQRIESLPEVWIADGVKKKPMREKARRLSIAPSVHLNARKC